MRACAAFLIFALPCIIHARNSRVREKSSLFADGINEKLIRFAPCVKYLGLAKCATAYGAWRAERALQAGSHNETVREHFPWQRYHKLSDEDLYTTLCDRTEKLLQRRSLQMSFNQDYSLQLRVNGNGSLNVDLIKNDETAGRSSMKKLQKHFYNLMPFIILPGLIMSAVLPFFLPTLKMMTLGAGMLNNMALTGAVFTLLRNNAFNDKYEKKVIYLNNGYLNDKYVPLADTPSQIIVDGDFDKYAGKYADKYAGIETHPVEGYQIIGNEPLETDYQIHSDWLKQITGNVNNVKILNNDFKANDWMKQYDGEKGESALKLT